MPEKKTGNTSKEVLFNKNRIYLNLVCFLGFMIIGLSPICALGEEGSGLELLRKCNKTSSGNELIKQLNYVYCMGYISGYVDANAILGGLRPEAQMVCPPKEGMQNEQALRIVIKWLEDHPAELHTSARMSVLVALIKAFPCN